MGQIWLLAAGLQPVIDSQKHITLSSLPDPLVVLPFSHVPKPMCMYFASDSLSSLPSLSHCLPFFYQITFRIFRAAQRVILVYPGTFTAVPYWVSLRWDSAPTPTPIYGSEMWDLLCISLILLKGWSDPVEIALLPLLLLVAYRSFQPKL